MPVCVCVHEQAHVSSVKTKQYKSNSIPSFGLKITMCPCMSYFSVLIVGLKIMMGFSYLVCVL